jgi:hypothetical protein
MAGNATPLRGSLTAHQLLDSERGRYVIVKALEMAIAHIDSLAPEDREVSDQADMRTIIGAIRSSRVLKNRPIGQFVCPAR